MADSIFLASFPILVPVCRMYPVQTLLEQLAEMSLRITMALVASCMEMIGHLSSCTDRLRDVAFVGGLSRPPNLSVNWRQDLFLSHPFILPACPCIMHFSTTNISSSPKAQKVIQARDDGIPTLFLEGLS